MKKSLQKFTMLFGLVLAFNAMAVSVYAGDVSEEMVQAVIDKMHTAADNKDTSLISDLFSDDVSIVMNIKAQGETQVVTLGKSDYLGMVQMGWDMAEKYEYNTSDVKIKIKGNTAVVKSNVKESLTIQGQSMVTNSKEVTTIEFNDGVGLITKVVGHTSM